jgi:hypothetical protein
LDYCNRYSLINCTIKEIIERTFNYFIFLNIHFERVSSIHNRLHLMSYFYCTMFPLVVWAKMNCITFELLLHFIDFLNNIFIIFCTPPCQSSLIAHSYGKIILPIPIVVELEKSHHHNKVKWICFFVSTSIDKSSQLTSHTHVCWSIHCPRN